MSWKPFSIDCIKLIKWIDEKSRFSLHEFPFDVWWLRWSFFDWIGKVKNSIKSYLDKWFSRTFSFFTSVALGSLFQSVQWQQRKERKKKKKTILPIEFLSITSNRLNHSFRRACNTDCGRWRKKNQCVLPHYNKLKWNSKTKWYGRWITTKQLKLTKETIAISATWFDVSSGVSIFLPVLPFIKSRRKQQKQRKKKKNSTKMEKRTFSSMHIQMVKLTSCEYWMIV